MHKVLWVFYFTVAPFLYTQQSFDSFALKQSFFLLVLAIQSIFFFYCSKSSSLFFRLKHFDYIVLFYFLLRLVSSFTYIPELGLFPSLATLSFELFLFIFYLQLRILRLDYQTLDLSIKALTYSSFIVFLLQAFSLLKPLHNTHRFDANFFHPNVLGITFCSILIYFHSKNESNKVLYIFAITLLLVSFSKTAYLIYCFYLLGGAIYNRSNSQKLFKMLLFISFAYVFFTLNNQDPLSQFRNQLSQALSIKSQIFKATSQAIVDQPLGYGTGLFAYKIQRFLPDTFHHLFPNPNHHTLYKAHNFILEIGFESGLLAFFLLIYAILYLISFEKSPVRSCLLTLVITSMFSIHLNYPESQIFFMFLLAALSSSKDYLYD
ncbi:MAG: O-antigen ligase family protein [Candidatus Cloacimonetes bacterium]|nr:O-antigen ligase family protein [Candidatus Cloacimonadota bacterium]